MGEDRRAQGRGSICPRRTAGTVMLAWERGEEEQVRDEQLSSKDIKGE
jgi:hypothetical protein